MERFNLKFGLKNIIGTIKIEFPETDCCFWKLWLQLK